MFAYWQPPPQSGYNGKIHVALRDGESTTMLCGKRVAPTWTAQGSHPKESMWLCRTCELRQLRLKRNHVREALEGRSAKEKRDAEGVPGKYLDVRLEYLEGFNAGKRGSRQEFPFTGFSDTTPMYYEREGAWDAGVRDGRKARRKKAAM